MLLLNGVEEVVTCLAGAGREGRPQRAARLSSRLPPGQQAGQPSAQRYVQLPACLPAA